MFPMIRRISTKLLLAVLAAVVIPFVGFAIFVDNQMAERMSKQMVLYSLKGLAADLASRVDTQVEQHVRDVGLWAENPTCDWAIAEFEEEQEVGAAFDPESETGSRFRELQRLQFDAAVVVSDIDLLLLLDTSGRVVISNSVDSHGARLPIDVKVALYVRDFSAEPWFLEGLAGVPSSVDHHTSDLLPPRNNSPGKHAENYHLGFSAPVHSLADPERVIGVLFSLANWKPIQDEVSLPVLKGYFQGLVGPDDFPSAYGWIWAGDADTIIGHPNQDLYGQRVSGPAIGLPHMVENARAQEWGLYDEYTFRGVRKNAAFRRTASAEDSGFHWVIGVGIDNDDIFKPVRELRALLLQSTLLVLLLAVLMTMVIARRATSPIEELQRHTQKVASGDLDARIEVRSKDELGELAEAFNRMTAEIKDQRGKLVKAEKDAAWREMARQVAHDIKNPLTPIKLSVDLLRRAKDEGSSEFDHIFDRTIETVKRQVEHLREIASDFQALTGSHRPQLVEVDVGTMLGEVLALNAAWADEQGVAVSRTGPGGRVLADPGLLRRVLINLVSNAFDAMPEGGELVCDVSARDGLLLVELRDTGVGIPDHVRPHLFEPYFTTRSAGTGLGLAIARRVVEEMHGTIALVPAQPGPGTIARIELPLADGAQG